MRVKRSKRLLVLLPALCFGACHFFEHPDNLEEPIERCPLYWGYPCPCDATTAEEGVKCDDGSICLYGTDPTRGFCSRQCDELDSTTPCHHEDYGVTGICTPIGDTTSEGQCVVVCEYEGRRGDCPPGLACEQEGQGGFRACLPITEAAPSSEDSVRRNECSAFCNKFTRCAPGAALTLEECITNCIVDDWRSDDCGQCLILCSASDLCDDFNTCTSNCPCGG